jgi:putative acetyltransferase
VNHQWQGKGVGRKLLKHIEAEARKRRTKHLFADVSITAMPFFRKASFSVVRQQKKIIRNCGFRRKRV